MKRTWITRPLMIYFAVTAVIGVRAIVLLRNSTSAGSAHLNVPTVTIDGAPAFTLQRISLDTRSSKTSLRTALQKGIIAPKAVTVQLILPAFIGTLIVPEQAPTPSGVKISSMIAMIIRIRPVAIFMRRIVHDPIR